MKALLDKLFSWCPLYRIAIGGYWYYNYVADRRYDRSRFCRCGTDVKICPGVVFECPEKVKLGNGVRIGHNCYIEATGGLQIGNCSGLGMNTTILTVDHQSEAESIPFGDSRLIKPVVIEDNVWVGQNVAILPGVTVGEGAIIGLGAVVRQDVPACAIVVGNPARVVGYRDKDRYDSLKNSGAARPVSFSCRHLWVSPEMRRKYGTLLKEIGYDGDTPQCERRRNSQEAGSDGTFIP